MTTPILNKCEHVNKERRVYVRNFSRNYIEIHYECIDCGKFVFSKEKINPDEKIGIDFSDSDNDEEKI